MAKKHGQSTFGYKLTVNVDNQHKFIRAYHPDTAEPHDTNHFDKMLYSNTRQDIYADSGYTGQQKRNNCIAKVRARVEHSFASIAHMGAKCIRSIIQARANFKMAMMALCHSMT